MSGNDKNPAEAAAKERSWLRRNLVYILSFVGAIAIMGLALGLGGAVGDFKQYGYLGVFLMALLGCAAPVWPVPGVLASFIAGGLGYNPFLVALAAGVGEPIGELPYYLGGYSGKPVMQKIEKWRVYNKLDSWMKRHGMLTMFLLSLVPNYFIRFADASAGAMRFPMKKFLPPLWAGKTLKNLGFAFAGAGLLSFLPFIQTWVEKVWG